MRVPHECAEAAAQGLHPDVPDVVAGQVELEEGELGECQRGRQRGRRQRREGGGGQGGRHSELHVMQLGSETARDGRHAHVPQQVVLHVEHLDLSLGPEQLRDDIPRSLPQVVVPDDQRGEAPELLAQQGLQTLRRQLAAAGVRS